MKIKELAKINDIISFIVTLQSSGELKGFFDYLNKLPIICIEDYSHTIFLKKKFPDKIIMHRSSAKIEEFRRKLNQEINSNLTEGQKKFVRDLK